MDENLILESKIGERQSFCQMFNFTERKWEEVERQKMIDALEAYRLRREAGELLEWDWDGKKIIEYGPKENRKLVWVL